MPDNVSISYRGATYALGQGPQFYGIWYATALHAQPHEWWPLTPEGWTAAWSRFASVEDPRTIRPVAQPPVAPMTGPTGPPAGYAGTPAAGQQAGWQAESAPDPVTLTRNARLSAVLLGLGVVLGVLGLFPVYTAGVSLASQAFNLAPHVIYLAVWTLSAVLILLGGTRLRVGALLGLGTSAVTLGLFVADAGTPVADGAHGAGLVLGILGWVACSAGVALATVSMLAVRRGLVAARGLAGRFGAQPGHDMVPLVSLILAALGAAIAFAPSWDSFTLLTSSGASQTVTAGNAFANPGAVITGDVLVMIALVAVVVVAALWRPLRLGAALALGAAIPMVAQAISAIIQVSQPTSPLQFGISSAEAARLGLTIHSGLTPMFWVYCAFLGTLILLCAWMLLAHGQAVGSPAVPGERLPGSPAVGQPPSTPAYPGAADGPGSPTGPPTTGGAASSAGAPSPVGTVPAAGSAAGSESGAP
ncbi:MAG TPA: hypothetical protein VEH05_06520 [Streptosporangiaceae bacterium]|nr:hypothetical protein [Streptosporangiaceae bacterium]